jgi:hypothetical protein
MAQKKLHRKGERHIFVWTVSEHDHTLLGLFFSVFLFFLSYRITTRPGGHYFRKRSSGLLLLLLTFYIRCCCNNLIFLFLTHRIFT